MEFYIVKYPNSKDRVFLDKVNAKICLSNLWNDIKWKIECYYWEKQWSILRLTKNNEIKYVEIPET